MAAGALAPKKLGLVVAAARSSRGIGIAGGIPWRLKADMAHFKKVTSETSNPGEHTLCPCPHTMAAAIAAWMVLCANPSVRT
eukprot:m.79119 g.79119  ORF g.79119 m.79119 type:complete len:82 (-) comp14614_c0_seq1:187-432(-)